MTEYKISLYDADRVTTFDLMQEFRFKDYDSVSNLISYMSEGSDNVLIRIQRREVEDDEQ